MEKYPNIADAIIHIEPPPETMGSLASQRPH